MGQTGFGVYLHIPFCRAKCVYCDFFSVPAATAPVPDYLRALEREMELAARILDLADRRVFSVYLGGGTPTILTAAWLAGLLQKVAGVFSLDPECEITVEANPGTVDEDKLKTLRGAGVTRLSLGVQSLEPALLARIGRTHDREEVEAVITTARRVGFTVSLDLIYGLPGQSLDGWRRTLQEVIALAPDHISAYGLKVEPGTPLARDLDRGLLELPSDDEQADMYEEAVRLLAAAGYARYEISNFARPGQESRHNHNYWENGDYLGLGAGAHSRLDHRRWLNRPDLTEYMGRIAAGELPAAELEYISREQEMAETMFLGLRLAEGVSLPVFARRFGVPAETVFAGAIAKHTATGLLLRDGDRLRLSSRGFLLANEVFLDFLEPELPSSTGSGVCRGSAS